MKRFNLELLSVFVVAVVAFGGFVWLNTEDSSLTGYYDITVNGERLYSSDTDGLGTYVIDFFKDPGMVKSIRGTTCYKHKRTGDYYRFSFNASLKETSKGVDTVVFKKDYPEPPNWFGGKGNKCHNIFLDVPNFVADKVTIKGVVVKGRPSVYNTKFSVVVSPIIKPIPVKTPITLSCRKETDGFGMCTNSCNSKFDVAFHQFDCRDREICCVKDGLKRDKYIPDSLLRCDQARVRYERTSSQCIALSCKGIYFGKTLDCNTCCLN